MLTDDATREPSEGSDEGRLVMVVIDERTERHLLPQRGILSVGRGKESDLRLRQPWVSRLHFRLHVDGDSVSIEDAQSSYGVIVRGEQLAAGSMTRLSPGDVVEIGTTLLLLQRGVSPRIARHSSRDLEELLARDLVRAASLGLAMDVVAIDPGAGSSEEATVEALTLAYARLPHALSDGLVITFASRPPAERPLDDRLDEQLTMRGLAAGIGSVTALAGRDAGPPADEAAWLLVEARRGVGRAAAATPGGATELLLFGPDSRDIRARLEALAPIADVLLVGEPGSGKSAMTRLLRGANGAPGHVTVALEGRALDQADLPRTGTLLIEEAERLDIDAQRTVATQLRSCPELRAIATTSSEPSRWLEPSLAGRFAGSTVHLPALRERPRDLEVLVRHFARVGAIGAGRRRMEIPPEVMSLFRNYPWPGNLREVAAVVVAAAAAATGTRLRVEDLAALTGAGASGAGDLRGQLASLERQRIVDALERHGQNQSAAARALGMPRNTLLARLREYKLERPKKPGRD